MTANAAENGGKGYGYFSVAAPSLLAQNYPTEVWGALVGCFTVILGLIAVLWTRLNNDIKGHETKLNTGSEEFQDIREELVRIQEHIKTLKANELVTCTELDRITADIKTISDKLLVMKTQHDANHAKK